MTAEWVVDLFGGPGGWAEACRQLGLLEVGIEWDEAACLTRKAAGHAVIRADVAQYPTEPFIGRTAGLIASPPCQAWSMAGKRKGEMDRANCHKLVDRMAAGDDSTDWTAWEDERSPLVAQPVRWVRDIRPEWVALEQVPAVLGLWQHVGRVFDAWGYSTWAGTLVAADYGVPQTRERAFLIASKARRAAPPAPTHCNGGHPAGLFGDGHLEPWVSMASALGWIGRWVQRERSGVRAFEGFDPQRGPCQTITSKARSWQLRNNTQANAALRHADEPAPTLFFGARCNDVSWVFDRPATTIVGSFSPDVVAAPGYRLSESRQEAEASVRVTAAEASVLQSFRADYPWQGSRSKQFEQIGNAVPPLLALHVLSAATGLPFPGEVAA